MFSSMRFLHYVAAMTRSLLPITVPAGQNGCNRIQEPFRRRNYDLHAYSTHGGNVKVNWYAACKHTVSMRTTYRPTRRLLYDSGSEPGCAQLRQESKSRSMLYLQCIPVRS